MFLTGQGETKDWTENHIFTSLMNYFGLSLFVVQKKKRTWKPVVGGTLYLCVTDLYIDI